MSTIAMEVWGRHAQRFAACHTSAHVAAVFSRSLHLAAGTDFLCLGDASIGRGPLNAILAHGGWARLGAAAPSPGDVATIDGHCIRIGRISVDTSSATAWRASAWPTPVDGRLLAHALDDLQHLARRHAPADGLARMLVAPAANHGSTLERVARPRIERLGAWLGAGRLQPAVAPPPVDLLGLGPGLTPSGDDLLCGALLALHAVAWRSKAVALARSVAAAALTATSPLSAAFLRAAAEGLGCEPLHGAVAAVLAGRTEPLAAYLAALDRIGHTSGWDALAGALLVLQAFSPIAGQGAGVATPMLSL